MASLVAHADLNRLLGLHQLDIKFDAVGDALLGKDAQAVAVFASAHLLLGL